MDIGLLYQRALLIYQSTIGEAMNDVLCVIGDDHGLVNIAQADDVQARLRKLQRLYPRDLRLVIEMPGAGHLAASLRARFSQARLRGYWFELAGAASITLAVTELSGQECGHESSYAAYTRGCRLPGCIDARRAYQAELMERHAAGDRADRRKRPGAAMERISRTAAEDLPREVQPVAVDELPVSAARVVQEHPDMPEPVAAGPAEPAPQPESRPGDEGLVLAYLRRFTMPNKQIFSAIADINILATATSLEPDRVAAAVREQLKSGALVRRGTGLFLGAR